MSYEDKTRESARLFERASQVIPGGICHNLRYFPPYPFYVERAQGPYVWDIDGNRYVDFWMGHYTHILGHNHPLVREAVVSFIKEKGFHFGLPNREEVELAELVTALVPCAEMVRFCSSGTEATMYAVRLARAFTGKKVVVKVKGGWHGASTDLSVGISHPFDVPESEGLLPQVQEYVRTIRFNHWEETERVLDEVAEDLACVIIEPVLGVGGFIPADTDYLVRLKEKLESLGALLIFDEIITGFRVSTGGYQKICGVTPHLATLGKVLGGGFPIGAVAGLREILELGSWRKAKPSRVLMGGGTFSCNPVSMVAGAVVIKYLVENEDRVYGYFNGLSLYLRKKIESEDLGVAVRVTGIGSLFMIHFLKDGASREIRCAEDVIEKTYWDIRDTTFRRFMASCGAYLVHAGGAFSLSHGEEHINFLVEGIKRFCEEHFE